MIIPVKANQIIASILETPSESRSIEFKPGLQWRDANHQHQLQDIIKSILGMSNIRDGGKIILGVPQKQDKTFDLVGMMPEELQTYDQDHIYQVVRAYANPAPRFEITNVEYNGKYFIVISIQDFLYTPVICIKNGNNKGYEPLVRGSLYIRTHKPETKKVEEEFEMREVINLAIDKEFNILSPRVQQLTTLSPNKSKSINDAKRFDDELKDINL